MSTFTQFPTDKIRACSKCHVKPEYYEMGHGRTPYSIFCTPGCLSLHEIMPSGVGWHLSAEHAIEAWNDFHNTGEILWNHGIEPTVRRVREYDYREKKGWGHNPMKMRESIG